jgi:SAM-dependent methyltransferase
MLVTPSLSKILYDVVVFAVAITLMFQVRKPSRWLGRPFLWIMNRTHSNVTDWGLQHIQFEPSFTLLDVGCGGGRNIQKLAGLAPEGKVYGVDYATGSVAASRAMNAPLIASGRVIIERASVSQLPFTAGKFDLVTAVETQYYWPDLPQDMREILRVLKPGGTLIVINETYKNGSRNKLLNAALKLLNSSNLGVDEHRALLVQAGYTNVQIFEENKRGWLCAVGQKPL